MEKKEFIKLIKEATTGKKSIEEICSLFSAIDFNDLCTFLLEYSSNNLSDLVLLDEYFIEDYHTFLYILSDLSKNEDEIGIIDRLIINNLNLIKIIIKPYNKSIKQKDELYYLLIKLRENLKRNLTYLGEILENKIPHGDKFIYLFKYLITNIKDIDGLYAIFKDRPNLVNIKNEDGESLFRIITRYYLNNIDNLEEEEKKYFKRLIMMFLESDELKLSDEEIQSILLDSKYKLSNTIESTNDINFLIKNMESHYPIKNKDFRKRAIDYCNLECPIEIIKPRIDSRIDLTNIFTITIDLVRNIESTNLLFDDAFSYLKDAEGNSYIYMHVPDVDFLVERDSLTDKYMRGIGESVYKEGYKTPLLNYKIARELSLKSGNPKYALTFVIKVDPNGNVLNIDFFKSIVKVNYNLSRYKADIFMKNNTDSRLYILNDMYEIAKKLKKNRKEKKGKRTHAATIMDEFNILTNLATAKYFYDRNIIFPYENHTGKIENRYRQHIIDFADDARLENEEREVLFTLLDSKSRTTYDIINKGNSNFNGLPYGNVGNPLRQYISLETDRLIKDIIIDKLDNIEYWKDRIERDCIEYTETSAKIRELYRN